MFTTLRNLHRSWMQRTPSGRVVLRDEHRPTGTREVHSRRELL